jgi:thiamine kinase-like enzyme
MLEKMTYNKLCSHFSLGSPLSTPTPLLGGRIHQQWKIQTQKGMFVIKALNKMITSREGVLAQYRLTEKITQVFSSHITLVNALLVNDDPLFQLKNTVYMVFPYINANTLKPHELTYQHSMKISQVLATLHNVSVPFNISREVETYNLKADIQRIEKNLKNIAPNIAQQLTELLPAINEQANRYHQNIDFYKSDLVVSHRDLDLKNVIWDNNHQPIIIDWESAGLINQHFDLISTAIYWSIDDDYTVDTKLFSKFIAHYGALTSISLNKSACQLAITGLLVSWINWLTFNLIRLQENSIESLDYQTAMTEQAISFKALPHMIAQTPSLLKIMHNTHLKDSLR